MEYLKFKFLNNSDNLSWITGQNRNVGRVMDEVIYGKILFMLLVILPISF